VSDDVESLSEENERMRHTIRTTAGTVLLSAACLAVFSSGPLLAGTESAKILDSFGRESGLFVVIGCGEASAPRLAVELGANGNSLVHAIAGSPAELAAFNRAIADANVNGCVAAEELPLATLPYRDYMVNVIVIMDLKRAQEAGLRLSDVHRRLAPYGRLVTCEKGRITGIQEVPMPPEMDTWTHRYHSANGIPVSTDAIFDLPVGFKWNAGLPMNFDNPVRAANRYSSTRALVLSDGRCFTFSTAVCENLGGGWRSKYGTDQYLTCRDAFNGRMIWRKRIGGTYYGGLYIENMAPLVSEGGRLFTAGENGAMLCIDAKTGETVRELATAFIPGVIAASQGVVVAGTWKGGKVMGSIKRYDRRRMDWEIGEGTMEAYDVRSGRRLWKDERLGTSLLIDDGRVFIVSRSEKDDLEKNHNRKRGDELKHPPQKVVAMDLRSGRVLWEVDDGSFNVTNQAINLEAAGHGALAVAYNNRSRVALLSVKTGACLDKESSDEVAQKFFRYRNHICTPVMRVNDVILDNRGGNLTKPGLNIKYAGARGGCLTGTVPAYGAGYITQNWCRCSPGQIPGLLAIAPIGWVLAPSEMEAPTEPIARARYDRGRDGGAGASPWSSFRGNAERSSSAAFDVPKEVSVAWSKRLVADTRAGTVKRDWRAYLNSRLTASVISGDLAIVGDIDQNEVIAVGLEDGEVEWRFMTGGRMDTAPTVHGGICLVADHTGYVSAVRARTGELIYRLCIAPEERRMVSYGKVESVWPAIGGVMVADGAAYASAGRTQGSDGGLVVRAFVPETGRQLWARALPQDGYGLVEKKPKRNDALVRHDDYILVMGHRLDLKTGRICPDPLKERVAKAVEEEEKKLGRKLDRKERGALEKKLAVGDKKIIVGLEGLYSWNWTRLGHRKFMAIGYAGRQGDTVSWNEDHIATCDRNGKLSVVARRPEAPKARVNLGFGADRQVTSLILCKGTLLVGGAILDKGKPEGFIRAVALEDGATVWEQTSDAQLAFNGLAVDGRGIIASFDDGTVVRLR
jgi:outer membrane protein assembly factor BamB